MVRTVRRNVSRGTTRKFIWARHVVASQVTGDPVGSDLLSQFETDYGAQLLGATVVRIRGYMFAFPSVNANAVDQFRFGARVASGNLDLTGAIPDQSPWTDEHADWMLWQPFARAQDAGGLSSTAQGSELSARMVDVKAARKIEELGERLIMVQGGSPGAPTIEWTYGWDLSIGVKLP